ncbi:MAG: ABC transporter permease [Gemmatimonadetes bacterium]|nr:ABC transporter permease [Gemmatimonadota bacterium]
MTRGAGPPKGCNGIRIAPIQGLLDRFDSPESQTMRLVLRRLWRSPTFAIASVLTLAIGIGANAAIFTVFNGVLLRPLPYDDPDELVSVMHTAPGIGFDRLGQSASQHLTYLDESTAFVGIGMWEDGSRSVTGLGEPENVDVVVATQGVLPLLRAPFELGRSFTAEEDSPDGPDTVILSSAYWRDRLGGDPNVLGRTLRIDGHAHQVVGVLAPEFRFLDVAPDLFLPMRLDRATVRTGVFRYAGLARLEPGLSLEQASAELARVLPLAFERFPGGFSLDMAREARIAPDLRLLKDEVLGDVGTALWALLGMVGLVLLIACANVTNLFLVRAEEGRRELAVRLALGASLRRTLRESLAESVTLGLLAGAIGLGLAQFGIRLLRVLAPANLPRLDEISIDGTVLGFTIAISCVAGGLFGLIPLLRSRRSDLSRSIRGGARGGGPDRRQRRVRDTLVTVEVALALILLVGSGLMIRSFQRLRDVHPGFERPHDVLTLRLTIPSAEVDELGRVALTHQAIARELEAIPGVASVAAVSSIPTDGITNDDVVFVDDFPTPEGELPPLRRYKQVGGDYFGTMAIPLLAGRRIDWRDVEDRADVVVVSAAFAEEYWGSASTAIGRRIKEWHVGRSREIVGVVGDVRDDGVDRPAPATVYWPMAIRDHIGRDLYVPRTLTYVVRTTGGEAERLSPAVHAAVWEVNANVPLADVQTLGTLLGRSMARTTFVLVMLVIAAVMALLLGVIGIYGVVSYIVSRRTREIGVRIALGARSLDVERLVLREGGWVIAVGVVLGLGGALAASRLMEALIFGIDAVDPFTYGVAVAAVAVSALLATYVPARRAARVDPSTALRSE